MCARSKNSAISVYLQRTPTREDISSTFFKNTNEVCPCCNYRVRCAREQFNVKHKLCYSTMLTTTTWFPSVTDIMHLDGEGSGQKAKKRKKSVTTARDDDAERHRHRPHSAWRCTNAYCSSTVSIQPCLATQRTEFMR